MFYIIPPFLLYFFFLCSLTVNYRLSSHFMSLLSFVLLSVFLGLRYEVGFDWFNYLDIFNGVGFNINDIGYLWLNDFFSNHLSYQALVFFISISLSCMLMVFFIVKSKCLSLAFLFLLITNVWFYNWLYYRQSIAVLIMLIPFVFNVKNKLFFLGFIAVAQLFHASSLFFVPVIFLMSKNFENKYYALILISSLIFSYVVSDSSLRDALMLADSYVNSGFGYYFDSSNPFGVSQTNVGLYKIALMMTFLFSLYIDNKGEDSIHKNMAFLFVFFFILSTKFEILNRLGMLFSVFYPLYITNVWFSNLSNRNLILMSGIFACVFIVFYFNYIVVSNIETYKMYGFN